MKGRKLIDLTDKRFGRLLVVSRSNIKSPGAVRWDCVCDCGAKRTVLGDSLRKGLTKSCGCLYKETRKTHGMTKTPTYKAWIAMNTRCFNKKGQYYKNYGSIGITVCESWRKSFENFLKDMGERPSSKHSLDRINPFGNYDPSNCQWGTRKEQANNKRCYVALEFLKSIQKENPIESILSLPG